MRTPHRHDAPGLIAQLCAAPGKFTFFQAIELLLAAYSREHKVSRKAVLDHMLRFANSRDLAFPRSDVASVAIGAEGRPRAVITALFMGLTGTHGALPHHYTQRLAASEDEGVAALLDILSNRFVRHFHVAWRRHTPHLPSLEKAGSTLQPLVLTLSGNVEHTSVAADVACFYAGAFAQRPASTVVIERVLADYFRIPITVQPNVGVKYPLSPDKISRLGRASATLDGRCVLGSRVWRGDYRARIRIGPLDKADYDRFLPDGDQVASLRALLAMFHVPGIEFEVVVVLAAAAVRPVTLGRGCRLGRDTFLARNGTERDREFRYLLGKT